MQQRNNSRAPKEGSAVWIHTCNYDAAVQQCEHSSRQFQMFPKLLFRESKLCVHETVSKWLDMQQKHTSTQEDRYLLYNWVPWVWRTVTLEKQWVHFCYFFSFFHVTKRKINLLWCCRNVSYKAELFNKNPFSKTDKTAWARGNV